MQSFELLEKILEIVTKAEIDFDEIAKRIPASKERLKLAIELLIEFGFISVKGKHYVIECNGRELLKLST